MSVNMGAVNSVGETVKDMVFKEVNKGTSKKNGNPFHMVVLHDPQTLENITFFLREGTTVSTEGLQFRDRVKAAFTMEFEFGRLQPVLQSIKKA